MEIDSLSYSRPISFDVKNNRQIRQTFDVLSYAKGKFYIISLLNSNPIIIKIVKIKLYATLSYYPLTDSEFSTVLKQASHIQ